MDFRCFYAAMLLIMGVACEKENQTISLIRCTDKGGLSINCSSTMTHLEKPDESAFDIPPFWCPDGYRLLKFSGKWTHVCQPQSCSVTKTNHTKTCKRTTKILKNCPKMSLNEDQYEIDDTGNLVDLLHNLSVELGSFVIDSTRAIICDPMGNDTFIEPSNRTELPKWCMPMVITRENYNTSDELLFIHSINLHVELFKIGHNETAHVCPKMEFKSNGKCKLGNLSKHEFKILPNWNIRHHQNILKNEIYLHGHYILAEDKSFAIICFVPAMPYDDNLIRLYAAACLFSAFFLLLTILVHLLYPKLNHHAKALLCLAFSFLVMYIALTVRYFSGNFKSAAANLTLFSFHYISTLSSFFWLSILSFDLWRAFADLRGPPTSENTTRQKRIFFAKCVYAWGIPTVLCLVIIALTYSPNVQKHIGLDLRLQTTNWIQDMKSMLIMLYTPIIIALIENVLFFILTIINLRKASRGTQMVNSNVNRNLFRVYIKLFMVMGLCWLTEIISWLVKHETGDSAWHATDIINCLQGVFIFLVYICKKTTLQLIKKKLRCSNAKKTQLSLSPASTQDKIQPTSAISLSNFEQREPEKPVTTDN